MKVPKYFYHTDDVLRDRLATKLTRREDLLRKLEVYDKEIHSLETELMKRGAKLHN